MSPRPDLPGPRRRRGPRPLWLHLGLPPPPAPGNWPGALPPPPATVDRDLLAGIAAYRRHPYRRTLAEPPPVWERGSARLLDYGPRRGLPVLFVPSLVNRAYVLDLLPERSMLRWLAARGIRPLLLDWGWPGDEERSRGLDAAVDTIEAVLARPGRPLVLAGYCMGGLLALAAAARRPRRVRAVALLATPWDFHADDKPAAEAFAGGLAWLEPAMQLSAALPVDAMQAMFAALQPGAVAAKFRAFAQLDPASDDARGFVALEDWLSDGVPLAAPVAREVFRAWYGENQPGRGAWVVGGTPVLPRALDCPAFIAVPERDRIVPPAGALALAAAMPGATVFQPGSGHIGMVAGRRAEGALWPALLGWLRGL